MNEPSADARINTQILPFPLLTISFSAALHNVLKSLDLTKAKVSTEQTEFPLVNIDEIGRISNETCPITTNLIHPYSPGFPKTPLRMYKIGNG